MMAAGKKEEEGEGESKMEIRLLDNNKQEGKLSFMVNDTDPSFVNTLRRIITEEVPVMAIEDVEFRKNSSILYDEIISHRLGLVPLKTDLKSYNLPEECKCKGEGCARCQLKMTLKSSKSTGMVNASELKSKDAAIKPVLEDMPIAKLIKGQEIELEATAVLGKGKYHSKWSPGLAYYKNKPSIDISAVKNPEAVVSSCPPKIFELKDGKLNIIKDKLLSCTLCEACVEADPSVKLDYSGKDFIFYLESWGQLTCKQIITEALEIFDKKFEDLSESLKKAE